MTPELDPRLYAFRPDLADGRLAGQVSATRFVDGTLRRVIAPLAPLRRHPAPDAPLETEALMGDVVRVFDEEEGFAWVQLEQDGYVGYLPASSLSGDAPAPSRKMDWLSGPINSLVCPDSSIVVFGVPGSL